MDWDINFRVGKKEEKVSVKSSKLDDAIKEAKKILRQKYTKASIKVDNVFLKGGIKSISNLKSIKDGIYIVHKGEKKQITAVDGNTIHLGDMSRINIINTNSRSENPEDGNIKKRLKKKSQKPSSKKKGYLDRNEFHSELTICKKQDKLTSRALEMFNTLATETSRGFYFKNNADKKDAIRVAMHDLFKYWRNFKESNVAKLHINRNFCPGDFIEVKIHGGKKIKYRASYTPSKPTKTIREFQIGDTINTSIENLMNVAESNDKDHLEIFVNKVRKDITFMDKHNNNDLSLKSLIRVGDATVRMIKEKKKRSNGKTKIKYRELDDRQPPINLGKPEDINHKDLKLINFKESYPVEDIYLITPKKRNKNKKKETIKDRLEFKFKKPPNAFSYFTSITRNGIKKAINEITPEQLRNGNKISMDGINSQNNGFYNL